MDTPTRPVSPLRQRMLDDMRMRKLTPKTQSAYIRAVCRFTRYLGRSPDTRVRQLRSQVLVFARAHFQKCHYNSANCSGAAGFSIPNA